MLIEIFLFDFESLVTTNHIIHKRLPFLDLFTKTRISKAVNISFKIIHTEKCHKNIAWHVTNTQPPLFCKLLSGLIKFINIYEFEMWDFAQSI